MNKKQLIILFLILVGAVIVRLYRFNAPVADWHSWRQVDTSAVSRNFVNEGFNLLVPKFDDLSNGVSLIDNPNGYRFVEFPIYNFFQAGLYVLIGKLTLEEWGRVVTIISSLISIVFIYLLVSKYINSRAAIASSLFFAFVPFSIYYGRTIIPDQSMVATLLVGTYFFSNWIEKEKLSILDFDFILALLFCAASLLLKPYALFFSLPLAYLAFKRYGIEFLKKWQLWAFLIISCLPLLFWHLWMTQKEFLAGIPRNDWLFNGNGIRFKGAFFHWIFAERIVKLLLGYWGIIFVALGILKKINKKEGWFFYFFIISSLIYVSVLATGNVQHDYYQILIIPTLAIFFGKGVDFILENVSVFNRLVSYILLVVSFIFMLAFGWFAVRDFYSIQHSHLIEAGAAVDKLTPKDAKIIAPYGGDTTFLYYTKRKGWPVFERSFRKFKEAGADYVAFVDPTPDNLELENLFKPVIITSRYAIFDLNKPTPAGLKEQQKKN